MPRLHGVAKGDLAHIIGGTSFEPMQIHEAHQGGVEGVPFLSLFADISLNLALLGGLLLGVACFKKWAWIKVGAGHG